MSHSSKILAVLFLICIASAGLLAQNIVDIKLKQPPPNQLGVGDMWNLELNNTSSKDMKIYLTGTATEEKDGLIIEGKSKVFTLKPGRSNYKYNDFSGAEVKYNNGKYKEIILRTGNAPEGNYTICVTAFDESGSEVGRENCIMQTVTQLGSITLLTPGDGEEIYLEQPVIFTWTPLQKADQYTLKIVELKGDQSPEVAIKQNRALFEKDGIKTTTYQYPISEPKLEEGKKYVWQVKSGDVESEIASVSINSHNAVTQIDTTAYAIELISPTLENPAKEIRPLFSWKVKKDIEIETYTIRIINVNKDRLEFDTNKTDIFYEAKGIKQQNWKYPENAPPFDTASSYIWAVLGLGKKSNALAVSTPSIIILSSASSCGFLYNWLLKPTDCNSGNVSGAFLRHPFLPMAVLRRGSPWSNSNFIWNCYEVIPTSTSYTVCQGQTIDFSLPLWIGSCIGTIAPATQVVWKLNGSVTNQPTSNMTLGQHTYEYIGSSTCTDGTTCSQTIPIIITVTPGVINNTQICSPTGNTHTQCCGEKKFILRETTNTNCIATSFPAGTSYQWYIMRSENVPNDQPFANVIDDLPTTNPCWNPTDVFDMSQDVWYKFGISANSTLLKSNINAAGNLCPLPANTTSTENYYVTCKITLPSTNNCPSGFVSNYFDFRVVEAPTIITADINSILPTCDNPWNGQIEILNVMNGTPPYEYKLNDRSWESSISTSNPIHVFEQVNALNNPTLTHVIRIRDANGCHGVFSVNQFGWSPNSLSIPSITGPTLIPCYGSVTLQTDPGFDYQWYIKNGNVYNEIPGETNITYNVQNPGTYRVRVSDNNGSCRFSNDKTVNAASNSTPIITGNSSICTGESITLTTNSAPGSCQWFLNNIPIMGIHDCYITVNTAGTYIVTSVVDNCPASSAPFVVTQTSVNCNNISISYPVSLINTNNTINGCEIYEVTFNINNNNGCTASYLSSGVQISSMAHFATGTLIQPSTIYNIPGNQLSTHTLQFALYYNGGCISLNSGDKVDIILPIDGTSCSKSFTVVLP